MIFRTLEDIKGTESEVKAENGSWTSNRILLKKDGMGFSFHHSIVYAGKEVSIWYKNHLEAVYCIEGEGEVETVGDNKVYPLKPGTLYALDKHDKHKLRAKRDLHLVCVFNPPLTGRETHDEDGSYSLLSTDC